MGPRDRREQRLRQFCKPFAPYLQYRRSSIPPAPQKFNANSLVRFGLRRSRCCHPLSGTTLAYGGGELINPREGWSGSLPCRGFFSPSGSRPGATRQPFPLHTPVTTLSLISSPPPASPGRWLFVAPATFTIMNMAIPPADNLHGLLRLVRAWLAHSPPKQIM